MFTSCSDDLTVTYTLLCSDDVLEYMQPTVKYIDGKGNVQELPLTIDNFSDFDGEISNTKGYPDYKEFKIRVNHDGKDFLTYMDVKFNRIKELPTDKTTFKYLASITTIATYEHKSATSVINSTSADVGDLFVQTLSKNLFEKELIHLENNGLFSSVQLDKKGNLEIY